MTIASYREFSGTAAQRYERFFVPHIAIPFSGELLRRAELRPGQAVLDVACGTGVIARLAATAVGEHGRVAGVDIAPDMLDVARATPATGAAIDWHEADASALPFDDETFDVVLCQMGLMFLEDARAALVEMHRVLKPGGRVAVNTPGRIQPLFTHLGQAISDHVSPELGGFVGVVFSMHDKGAVAQLLIDHGFENVDAADYIAHLRLPEPRKFLWSYINITPMAELVAGVSEDVKNAMEAQIVTACGDFVTDGAVTLDQPAIAVAGHRPRG